MENWHYALAALATYRLTMLVTNDYITRPVRVAVLKWLKNGNHPKVRYGFTCPWCASMWLSLPVVGLGYATGAVWWWLVGCGCLASSAVTGMMAQAGLYPRGNDGLDREVDGNMGMP